MPSPPWQTVQPTCSGGWFCTKSVQRLGWVRKTGLTSKRSALSASSKAEGVSLSVQACARRDRGRRGGQVLADLVLDRLVGVDHLGVERELPLHVRVRHFVLARLQDFPRRRETGLVHRGVAVLAAVDGGPSPGVLEVLDPVLIHLRPLAGSVLDLLL